MKRRVEVTYIFTGDHSEVKWDQAKHIRLRSRVV